MPTNPDPHTVLTAVADHIATNPALADTVTHVAPGRGQLQIWPVDRPGPRRHLVLLAEWIHTLFDVAPAIVTTAPTDTERAHLDLYCQLHDGTAVTLIVVLDLDESALLAGSVLETLRVGDAVSVELLLRLAGEWVLDADEDVVAELVEPVVERVPDQVEGQAVDTVTEPAEEPTS